MQRLLSTTAALSLALTPIQPWPLFAQSLPSLAEDGAIVAPDGTILCAPTPEAPCNPLEFGLDLPAPAAEAPTPEPEIAPPADPEPEEPAAEPEPEVAPEIAPEIAPEPEPEIAPEPLPEQEPVPEVMPEPEPELPADLPEEIAPEAPEELPAPEPEVEPVQEVEAGEAPAAESPATAPEAQAAAEPEAQVAVEPEAPSAPLPEAVEEVFERAEAAESAVTATPAEPVAPVDVPVVAEETRKSLADLLGRGRLLQEASEAVPPAAATPAEAATDAPVAPADVTETTVTEADTRQSFQDFRDAPQLVEGGQKKSGLSDLEKAGLVALGALVVGKMLSDGREVVNNTGDRIVIEEPDGRYTVYKDDDTLLRRPGSTVRTESFRDGSTRTVVTREDASQVVTIRDASGRVLRRTSIDPEGREYVLIDDLGPEDVIDVTTLPAPRPDRLTISAGDEDAALRAELARIEAERLGRSFSLRQVREITQLRHLAAVIDVDNITFDTGSAVIRTTEARKLSDLGRVMNELLEANPREVFLVEGHTDAVGSAASNLALSDRRAESVALALTEYFGIPPENMVVQGYGEYDLRVDTKADERRNRRVAIRVITPLLRTADLR